MGIFYSIKKAVSGFLHKARIGVTHGSIFSKAINYLEQDLSSTCEVHPLSCDAREVLIMLEGRVRDGFISDYDKQKLDKYYELESKIESHNVKIKRLRNKLPNDFDDAIDNPIKNKNKLFSYLNLYQDIKKYAYIEGVFLEFVGNYEKAQKNYDNIIKAFTNYIEDAQKQLNDFAIIKKIAAKYSKYLVDLENDEEYQQLVSDYKQILNSISNHNNDIYTLKNDLLEISFDKKEVIENPLNYQDIDFNTYDKLCNKISDFNSLPSEITDAIQNITFAQENIDKIIKQYLLRDNLINKQKFFEDKYYDYYDIIDEQIQFDKLLKESLNNSELFYDFNCFKKSESEYEEHNKKFIEKNISSKFFDDVDGKCLDLSQRIAVLSNPVSELTVAGAGSGKTLTICAKVKYLLDNKLAKPEDILLLTYSKNSSLDLADRVSRVSKSIKVSTFHSLGLAILTEANKKKQTIDDQGLARLMHDYFNTIIVEDFNMGKKVLTYYGLFLQKADYTQKHYASKGDMYEDLRRNNMTTLKDQLKEMSDFDGKKETFKHEHVKSYEELIIANYYFINGVDYEYEGSYMEKDTATLKRRGYTPDFTLKPSGIYHEHYGVNKDGRAPQYSSEEELEYIESMHWKRALHGENHTDCIETFSYEVSDCSIFKKIDDELAKRGIQKHPLDSKKIKDVMDSIYQGHNFESFIKLCSTFINLYKSRYRDDSMFKEFKKVSFGGPFENMRASLFIDICEDIYHRYMAKLREERKIDFDDMIIMAKDELASLEDFKYKYVIVDEFQDISYSRMEFLKEIIKHGKSKIYAVGDDWQAIYRFSGCDLNIFLNFEKYFEHARINNIVNTHRNAQEIQNVVEPFITKNPEQYKKHINSSIHIVNPIKLCYYDDNKLASLVTVINEIYKADSSAKILILGRNNRDLDMIIEDTQNIVKQKDGKVIFKAYPTLSAEYKTVHGSKGLESDYVILINAENSKYGFPNKVEDDVLLSLVLSDKSNYPFAEERRLWYVALTRTKKLTYILVDKDNPSQFVEEIKEQCEIINPELIKEDKHPLFCPNCKTGKMVLRENPKNHKQFYGCSHYPYCTYTTDDVELANMRATCPHCGYYMERRRGRYGLYLKCTNKKCGKTINVDMLRQYIK